MKVLYLCHRTPYPPDKGEKIRAFHQLAAMAERHEVDLFTLAHESEELTHRIELERYCRSVTVSRIHPRFARLRSLPYLMTNAPLTVPYFHSAELHAQVRHAMLRRSYDRIFIYCSSMAQYVDLTGGIPALIDFVDVDSDKWTQYAGRVRFPFSAVYRREGRRLREYERRIAESASCILVTTEREARLAKEISPSARVHVVANGVDTDHFRPPADASNAVGRTIIFVGDMAYFPNQDAVISFVKNVLPLVQRSVPDTSFLIVGRNPSPSVQALRQIAGVEVTGYVPDVRTFLAKARVSVAPFSMAAGIQNKILESMACGVPVVGTPRAIQGLSNGVAQLVETGEDAAQLAEALVGLLRDPEFARRRGMEGRRQVTADYSWRTALDYLLQVLEHPTADDLHPGLSTRQVEAE
jgi:polysaccharide biosynthesis protein PslH